MALTQNKPSRPLRQRPRRRWASFGAAYTETVVMLPFFVAVWSCMIYVHKAYSTKVYTMAENRRCVTTYAFNACRSSPSGCSVTRGPGSDSGGTPGELSGFIGALGSVGGALFGAIFGENANARTTRTVNKPPLLGGGSTSVLAGNTMSCNTEKQEPADVARSAFCTLTRLCS